MYNVIVCSTRSILTLNMLINIKKENIKMKKYLSKKIIGVCCLLIGLSINLSAVADGLLYNFSYDGTNLWTLGIVPSASNLIYFNPATCSYSNFSCTISVLPLTYPISTAGSKLSSVTNNYVWMASQSPRGITVAKSSTGINQFYPTSFSIGDIVGIPNSSFAWFTETTTNKIGIIDASSGAITEYTLTGVPSSVLGRMVIDSSGTAWIAIANSNQFYKVTLSSCNGTCSASLGPNISRPIFDMVLAPNSGGTQDLWVTERPPTGSLLTIPSYIGRFSTLTNPQFTEYNIGSCRPLQINHSIVVDGTGNIWFLTTPSDNSAATCQSSVVEIPYTQLSNSNPLLNIYPLGTPAAPLQGTGIALDSTNTLWIAGYNLNAPINPILLNIPNPSACVSDNCKINTYTIKKG